MKRLFIAFLLFSFAKINAQLTGSAFLVGQTNHAGIKIKFISNSGTAVTDSSVTDAAGAYSINISGGVYTIVFSKTGYQTSYYNNNALVVLTNTSVLTPVSLAPGTIVNVSGAVSGNWTNTNIYVVNNNISVPTGSALTIQPGTLVKFNGSFSITVDGTLNAIGNSANKIKFTSNNTAPAPGNWKGLFINSSQSNIKHCLIEYAESPIFVSQASPSIEDNEITKFNGSAISLNINCSSLVKNNVIHDFTTNHYAFGINTYNCNAKIECNTIYDGTGRGMSIGDGSSIKNNLIYNIGGEERGYGIDLYYISNARVENNIIHHCNIGILYGETVGTGPNPLIINNTIFSNLTGIGSQGIAGSPAIIGNIIANNTNGILQGPTWGLTPSEISYNLLWNNSGGDFAYIPITGIGQTVNTNSNGDPVDAYFNLAKNPLFINGGPGYSSSSPCVNAGDPDYSTNIGCNIASLCSQMVVGVKENKKDFDREVFPNPFSSAITLRGIKTGQVEGVEFYDLTGKRFEAKLNLISASSLSVEQQDLIPGIYFLEITFSDSSKEYIRVIKE